MVVTEIKALYKNNKRQLKEAVRLQRIHQLYADILDKYSFAQYFFNEVKILIAERQKEIIQLQCFYTP